MKLNIVPARTGLTWVKLGAVTFLRQPLALTGLFFMYMAAVLVISQVPLLGIVAAIPWSLTSLVAVALSITLVPLVPAGPPAVGLSARGSPAGDLLDTLAAFAARYGGAVLVLLVGLRGRRRGAAREGGLREPSAAGASRAAPGPAARG